MFRSVYCKIFDDPDYQSLNSNAKLVLLTLRLCESSGTCAIFRYYKGVLVEQTGLTEAELLEAFDTLSHTHWIAYDRAIIWVLNGLKFEPSITISNPKHLISVKKHLRSLPKSDIVLRFCKHYGIETSFLPYSTFPCDPSDTHPIPIPIPMPIPEPEPDPEPDPSKRKIVELQKIKEVPFDPSPESQPSSFADPPPSHEDPAEAPRESTPSSDQIREVFEYWRETLGKKRAILDEGRRKKVRARLTEGYTVEDLKAAIRGIRHSPHHMGENEHEQVYDDLTVVCKSAKNVDSFMELDKRGEPVTTNSGPDPFGHLERI